MSRFLFREIRLDNYRPDYVQSSACAPGAMETRAQALQKPSFPRKRESTSVRSLWIPAFAGMTG